MTASPSLSYVSVTRNNIFPSVPITKFMALVQNNSDGMVKMKVFNYDTGICVEDPSTFISYCLKPSYNEHFSTMWDYITMTSSTAAYNKCCLRLYTCSSGEGATCGSPSCTTWNTSYASGVNNISIDPYFGNTPAAVSGFTLTPASSGLDAYWGDSGQTTSIFAYQVILKEVSSGNILADNFLNNSGSEHIGNLTNGVNYELRVRALSFDGKYGPWSYKTASPLSPCTTPTCDLILS